jgi:uncharacterized protein (DUF3084 family)
MPPPNKCFKAINHRDIHYRWIMQNLSGSNELRVEASAAVNGQVLLGALPRIVNNEMVTEAIDFALANGWRPNEMLPPFRCRHTRKGFVLPEP